VTAKAGPLRVRVISAEQHSEWIADQPAVSFLQCPSWGAVKAEWGHESLGWFAGEELVGAGLVLYRQVPRLRYRLAYLPEGPVVPWHDFEVNEIVRPLLAHARSSKSFAVKMGPPLVARTWYNATVKAGIAADAARLEDLHADATDPGALAIADDLRAAGWRQPQSSGAGFGDVQPRYVFQVPLADRSTDDIFGSFNQLWRRNIRKAERAGVTVEQGAAEDLATFHELYQETAVRDRFTPRPLRYFERMWSAMRAEDPDRIRLYLARHNGVALAAATWVKVGDHVWYSYGASANEGRDVRPSNALQWRMLTDAHDAGAATYDLRGISDTLDDADPLFGLIRFKVGTGGNAVEYVGEFDYPINRPLYAAFSAYLRRRS
jgi:lipid II:glycine glycyltransferase (peptidoglycan interpeptide bridge formation enzyme)